MRKRLLLVVGIFIVFMHTVSSQVVVNKDSLSLVKKLTNDREKLLKLQNQLTDRTKEKEETAVKAQESADENRQAANKLSSDPQDRKLARRADKAASDARSDAKKARKAADQLEDLNKDIRDLTERIAKEETKLNIYVQENKNRMSAPTVVVPIDSPGRHP